MRVSTNIENVNFELAKMQVEQSFDKISENQTEVGNISQIEKQSHIEISIDESPNHNQVVKDDKN